MVSWGEQCAPYKHGANTDNPQFYENISDIVYQFYNEYYIVCGDFNLAFNPLQDTHNYFGINNPKARFKVLGVMEDLQLLAYYRVLNPDWKANTWRNKSSKARSSWFFPISNSLFNLVENCTIKPGYKSDHFIVLLKIWYNPFKRGRDLWKFNNNFLTDKNMCQRSKYYQFS